MFRFFENLLRPTEVSPERPPPVEGGRQGLVRFYVHFVRQARGLLVALFCAGLLVALMDVTIPVMIGRVVELVGNVPAETLLANHWHELAVMAVVMLVLRPAALLLRVLITNQAIASGLMNLVRWQNHWHVVRQSWSFFQNDFAGRIANRVMQTGPSLRESVVSATNAVWYIIVYGTSAVLLLAHIDGRLALPMLAWFVAYGGMLRYFGPRMRDRSRAMSEVRSALTGRIVDSYTNILTVKLFARARDEDDFVRETIDEHTTTHRGQLRLTTRYILTLNLINACLIVGTGAMAIWLWRIDEVSVGTRRPATGFGPRSIPGGGVRLGRDRTGAPGDRGHEGACGGPCRRSRSVGGSTRHANFAGDPRGACTARTGMRPSGTRRRNDREFGDASCGRNPRARRG